MREVQDEDDKWRESSDRRREDLELHVFVQERPRRYSQGTSYPEPLVWKHLCIAHPMAVLKDA
jgi:hypothetical protein